MPRPLDRWALRPVARVKRVALFEREVRERLSASALDLVLARAKVLSEGQRAVRAGKDAYFGSTMLTIDLEALAPVLRDACDAGCAARLAGQLAGDARALAQVKAIAARETERVAGVPARSLNTEVKVRFEGARVFLDVDVEAGF